MKPISLNLLIHGVRHHSLIFSVVNLHFGVFHLGNVSDRIQGSRHKRRDWDLICILQCHRTLWVSWQHLPVHSWIWAWVKVHGWHGTGVYLLTSFWTFNSYSFLEKEWGSPDGRMRENLLDIFKLVLMWTYSSSWMDPCVKSLQDCPGDQQNFRGRLN